MYQLKKDNLLANGTLIQFNTDYGIEVKKGQIGVVVDHAYSGLMKVLVGEKLVKIFFWDVPINGWVKEVSVIDLNNMV